MSNGDCVFCKMVAGEIPVTKVYEDDISLAFLDIRPVSDGHTLMIPKRHFARLHECPSGELAEVASRLGRIAKGVCDAVKCDGYNLLCNNGRSAGQLVEHLHFHIIPRRTGDVVFDRWPSYSYEEGKAEAIAAEIRKNL